MKHVTIHDFLTDNEIKRAMNFYIKQPPHKLNGVLVEKIIGPKMDRINKALGQKNDPKYLAYAVEYTFLQSGIKRQPGLRLDELGD